MFFLRCRSHAQFLTAAFSRHGGSPLPRPTQPHRGVTGFWRARKLGEESLEKTVRAAVSARAGEAGWSRRLSEETQLESRLPGEEPRSFSWIREEGIG